MEAGGRRYGTDLRKRSERLADGVAVGAFPSPLVGEGGTGGRRPPYLEKDADALHRLWTRSGSETDEGAVSAERTPHPPSLREGTFSHKGRRKKELRRPRQRAVDHRERIRHTLHR